MQNLPFYIPALFIVTTALAVWMMFKAAKNAGLFLILVLVWLSIQAVVGLSGFYLDLKSTPPHFIWLLLPPLIAILIILFTAKGRAWLDNLDLKTLTWLHVVRIPVEVVLYLLFTQKLLPKIMTFEGNNFDILCGISAIMVGVLLFRGGKIRRNGLLIWNVACLMLLVNIVYLAVFSTPMPFQKFGFDQPNIAIFYFPFIWLPCCVVPLVLLAHVAAIRQLLKQK